MGHMDRLSKWATTGSLAWLLMAVGLILGTHSGTVQGSQATGTVDAPATTGACPELPAAPTAATAAPDFHVIS